MYRSWSLPSSLIGSECSDLSLVAVQRDIFERHTLYLLQELSVIIEFNTL